MWFGKKKCCLDFYYYSSINNTGWNFLFGAY